MPDGAIYAGISPDTDEPLYAAPAAATGVYNWNRAAEYCAAMRIHGPQGWRVPTKDELNLLYNNRDGIGGFDTSGSDHGGWYWSSSEVDPDFAWAQRFSDGEQYYNLRNYVSSVRCVR